MIELLDKKHNRKELDCGNELLNNYLEHQAGQDMRRKLAACFVLLEDKTKFIQGYYTLSNSSIPLLDFSESVRKKLPKAYSLIPTTLLGRLAIDNSDAQDIRDREERKSDKNYQLILLIIGLVFLAFLVVFLKDDKELLYKIIIAIISFVGGFGLGKLAKNKREE